MILPPSLIKYAVYAAAVALVVAAAWFVYHSIRQAGYDEADGECKEVMLLRDQADRDAAEAAKAAAKEVELLMGQVSIAQAAVAAQQARKREIQYVEVTKWRTKYAKNPDAGKCVVPDEFVRVLDSTGQDSRGVSEETSSGSGVDAIPGRVSDVELLQYSTDVKMLCLKWRDQLIWWQERERELQALEVSGNGGKQ